MQERSLTLEMDTWEKVTVSDPLSNKRLFTYDLESRRADGLSHLPSSVLHASGLSLFENFEQLKKKILISLEKTRGEKQEATNLFSAKKMLCIALDTNAILSNTYYHLISDINLDRYQPFLLLLSQAIAHEFHYKQSFKISRKEKETLIKFVENKPATKKLFLPFIDWKRILNETGRRGLLGMAKFEQLTHESTIVTRSHGHLFYSAPIISETSGIPKIGMDSVYDTLIQTEIELFQATTNAQILFISGDQFLVNMFGILGIDAFQLKYPHPPNEALPQTITNAQFHQLLTELLVYCLIVRLDVQTISSQETFYLTYANETVGKKTHGKNALVVSEKNDSPWLWNLRIA